MPKPALKPYKCGNCGDASHTSRRQECKAFNVTCACGIRGHLTAMCRNKGKPRKPESNAAIFPEEPGTIYQVSNQPGTISAIVFNKQTRRWQERPHSEAEAESLKVRVSVDGASLNQFTRDQPRKAAALGGSAGATTETDSIPDTGASVVCSGPSLLRDMSLSTSVLVPTKMRLFAANGKRLTVMGCLPCDINIAGAPNNAKEMVYIVRELRSLFLSKHALISLGCVSSSFPRPQAQADKDEDEVIQGVAADDDVVGSDRAPCGCLKRTVTPPPPVTDIPMTDENIPV